MNYYQKDTIILTDKNVFGDNNEYEIEMEFYDGYAISLSRRFCLTYPMYKHLSEAMIADIEEFTGRECDSVFDIALLYGKVFSVSDPREEEEHDFIMSLLTDDQLEELEQFLKESEQE